jgi:enterochelin esterase-like enzyme
VRSVKTFALFFLGGILAQAQSSHPFYAADALSSPRTAALSKSLEGADRNASVAAFWAEMHKAGTPLVEPVAGEAQYSWVTFLWQAKENTINVAIIDGVAAGIGGSDPAKSLMTHLPRTDLWYRTYKVRNDAAFHYWLSPNDCLENTATLEPRNCKPQPDPLNPRRLGPVSYLELPGSPGGALSIAAPSLPRGKVERTKLHSATLNNDRDVWIYTPYGYEPAGPRYPLLVVFDGGLFVDWVGVPAILDNLIAQKRIPPMVVALVAPVNRAVELACSKPFTEYLATELVPLMRHNYNATDEPSHTIVAGSSLGGLAAAFAGFQHPEVFGNVLSQSGSYWWSPPEEAEKSWLTRQFAQAPLRPLRISMSAGLMEIPDQLDTNRHLRDVLTAKGYQLSYGEFNGNHSYVSWRADFAGRLLALIGRE